MSPGKKPEMRKPPLRPVESAEDKLASLEKAQEWAMTPALSDATNAISQPSDAISEEGEGNPQMGILIRALQREKPSKSPVSHLLRIPGPLNVRIERLLDHIPRASKQKLILAAVEEYVRKVERIIEKQKNGQAANQPQPQS